VIEQDAHAELVAMRGRYADLFELQVVWSVGQSRGNSPAEAVFAQKGRNPAR
jgi:hypothetical protein